MAEMVPVTVTVPADYDFEASNGQLNLEFMGGTYAITLPPGVEAGQTLDVQLSKPTEEDTARLSAISEWTAASGLEAYLKSFLLEGYDDLGLLEELDEGEVGEMAEHCGVATLQDMDALHAAVGALRRAAADRPALERSAAEQTSPPCAATAAGAGASLAEQTTSLAADRWQRQGGRGAGGSRLVSCGPMESLCVRLRPGDEIRSSLLELYARRAADEDSAGGTRAGARGWAVVTCVGSVRAAMLRLAAFDRESRAAGAEADELWRSEEKFELTSLVGTLGADAETGELSCHLHATLCDKDGVAVGGHLVSATVFTTAEIVLAELRGATFARPFDADTGFGELLPIADDALIDEAARLRDEAGAASLPAAALALAVCVASAAWLYGASGAERREAARSSVPTLLFCSAATLLW